MGKEGAKLKYLGSRCSERERESLFSEFFFLLLIFRFVTKIVTNLFFRWNQSKLVEIKKKNERLDWYSMMAKKQHKKLTIIGSKSKTESEESE